MISDSHQNLSHEKSIETEFFRESPIVKSLMINIRDFSLVFVLFVGILGFGWPLFVFLFFGCWQCFPNVSNCTWHIVDTKYLFRNKLSEIQATCHRVAV